MNSVALCLLFFAAAAMGAKLPSAVAAERPPKTHIHLKMRRMLQHIARPLAVALNNTIARSQRKHHGSRRGKRLIVTPNVPILAQEPEEESCWAYARATALYATGAFKDCMPLVDRARYMYAAYDRDGLMDECHEKGEGCLKENYGESDIRATAELIHEANGGKEGGVYVKTERSALPLEPYYIPGTGKAGFNLCKLYENLKTGHLVTLWMLKKEGCSIKHYVTVFGMNSTDEFKAAAAACPAKGSTDPKALPNVEFLANDPWCPEVITKAGTADDFLKLGEVQTAQNAEALVKRHEDGKAMYPEQYKHHGTLGGHPCICHITITSGDMNDARQKACEKAKLLPKFRFIVTGLRYNAGVRASVMGYDVWQTQPQGNAQKICDLWQNVYKQQKNKPIPDKFAPNTKNSNRNVKSKYLVDKDNKPTREVIVLKKEKEEE